MDRLWTYEDLAYRWSIGERQVRRAVKAMGLRKVEGLGNNTVRFRPCSVLAAEEKAEAGRQGRRGRGWLD